MPAPVAAARDPVDADVVLAYHARTKHRLARYAAGPETLDWDAQPNPFREFAGCTRTTLPLTADRWGRSLAEIYLPSGEAAPLTMESVAALLELSTGLSA